MAKRVCMNYIDRIRREAARDWDKLISTDSAHRTPSAEESSTTPPADVSPSPNEKRPAA